MASQHKTSLIIEGDASGGMIIKAAPALKQAQQALNQAAQDTQAQLEQLSQQVSQHIVEQVTSTQQRLSADNDQLRQIVQQTTVAIEQQRQSVQALGHTVNGQASQDIARLGEQLSTMQSALTSLSTTIDSDFLGSLAQMTAGASNTMNALGDAKQVVDSLNHVAAAAQQVGEATLNHAAATRETMRYQAALGKMAGASKAATIAQTALVGAASAARGAMALMGGPAGIAIMAGYALYEMASSMDTAKDRAEALRAKTDEVTESIKGMTRAALNKTIYEYEQKQGGLRETIAEARQDIEAANHAIASGRDATGMAAAASATQRIKKAQQELTATQEVITSAQDQLDKLSQNAWATDDVDRFINRLSHSVETMGDVEKAASTIWERLNKGFISEDQATAGIDAVTAAYEAQKNGTVGLTNAQKSYIQTIKDSINPYNQIAREAERVSALVRSDGGLSADEAREHMEAYSTSVNERIAASRSEIDATTISYSEWIEQIERVNRVGPENAKRIREIKNELHQLYEKSVEAGGGTDQYRERVGQLNEELSDLEQSAGQASDVIVALTKETVDQLDEFGADLFENWFVNGSLGWHDLMDDMENSFKRMLGNLAWQLTSSAVLDIIQGGDGTGVSIDINKLFGLASSSAGGAGGLNIADIISGGKKAWDWAAEALGFGSSSTPATTALSSPATGLPPSLADVLPQSGGLSGLSSPATGLPPDIASYAQNAPGKTVVSAQAGGAGAEGSINWSAVADAGVNLVGGYLGAQVGTGMGEKWSGKHANSSYGATAGAAAGAYYGSSLGPWGAVIGAFVGGVVDAFAGSGREAGVRFQQLADDPAKTGYDMGYDTDRENGYAWYSSDGWHDGALGKGRTTPFGSYGFLTKEIFEPEDLNNFLDSLSTLDNTFAQFMSDDNIEAVKNDLSGYYYMGDDLVSIFNTRLDSILDNSGSMFADQIDRIAGSGSLIDSEQISDSLNDALKNIEPIDIDAFRHRQGFEDSFDYDALASEVVERNKNGDIELDRFYSALYDDLSDQRGFDRQQLQYFQGQLKSALYEIVSDPEDSEGRRDGTTPYVQTMQNVFGIDGNRPGATLADPELVASALASGLQIEHVGQALGEAVAEDMTSRFAEALTEEATQEDIEAVAQQILGTARAVEFLSQSADDLNFTFNSASESAYEYAESIVAAAGGIDQLRAMQDSYYANYYSQEEQRERQLMLSKASLTEYFDALDLAMPKSKTAFRELVESLDATTDSGSEAYVALMQIQGQAAQYYQLLAQQQAQATQDALASFELPDDMRHYLQDLSDWASQELTQISQTYAERIRLLEQEQRIGRELRQYVEELKISELSPSGPSEKLAEASAQFAALLVKAENGDMDAAGRLRGSAQTYLNNADGYYGRTGAYTRVFDDVINSLDSLGIDLMQSDTTAEKLNAEMLREQQRIRDHVRSELDWAQRQFTQLTSINLLLEQLPESLSSVLAEIIATQSSSGNSQGGSSGGNHQPPTQPDRPALTDAGWADQQVRAIAAGMVSEPELQRVIGNFQAALADGASRDAVYRNMVSALVDANGTASEWQAVYDRYAGSGAPALPRIGDNLPNVPLPAGGAPQNSDQSWLARQITAVAHGLVDQPELTQTIQSWQEMMVDHQWSRDDVYQQIKRSLQITPEPQWQSVWQYWQNSNQTLPFVNGSHRNGLASVPFDGYRAELHQAEMVLPAPLANHVRNSVSQPSVNIQPMVDLLQSLQSEVSRLTQLVGASADQAGRQREQQIQATQQAARHTRPTPVTVG